MIINYLNMLAVSLTKLSNEQDKLLSILRVHEKELKESFKNAEPMHSIDIELSARSVRDKSRIIEKYCQEYNPNNSNLDDLPW